MPSLSLNIRSDRANVINNALTTGGKINFYDINNIELYYFNWTGPVFTLDTGTSNLTWNAPVIVPAVVSNTGTINKAILYDSSNVEVFTNFSVARTLDNIPADIYVSNLDITAGDIIDFYNVQIIEGND